jgi:hypothetical protein
LIVPNSGVGAVFIDKGQPTPFMGNKGRVIPVYDGSQNVTADPRDAFKDLEAVLAEVEASPEYAYEQQIADLEQQVFARDEALREAREALVYYSKAEAYGRRIILNVEVMYDRGATARQALANIKAVMGEAG